MKERIVVLGAGIAGLAFAHRARSLRPDLDLLVLEGADRPGGVVRTDRVDGWVCEYGPSGVLDNAPPTQALADELGLGGRWVVRNESTKLRFVQVGGKLCALPSGPGQFLKSDLLTLRGKLRLLCEPFIGRSRASEPETVAAFGRRRLGAQAVERLLDPFVTGVFGGDIERLELAACFPKLASMEALHGSLFQGMRKGGAKAGALRSFRDGMEELVQALAGGLGERLCLRATVGRVEIKGGGFVVHAQGRPPIEATRVVCCLPAPGVARVLGSSVPALAGDALAVPAVGIVSIHLGLPASAAEGKIRGFGYLVPGSEHSLALGCLFISEIFAHRAPPGMALVRFMLGGARAPQVMGMSDAELVALCVEELRKTTGVEAGSGFRLVHRIPRAIPQYTQGHLARVARVEAAVAQHPGLHLLGASWRGVSVNDNVAQARELAERVVLERPAVAPPRAEIASPS